MQLIFDDLQELKDFIQEFLGEAPASASKPAGQVAVMERPPVATPDTTVKAPVAQDAPRRGRPPKSAEAAPAVKQAKQPKASAKSAPEVPSRRRDGLTLTDRIRSIIDKFITDGKAFSANAVFDEIYKKDKDVNKQSVITSVLKQMTTNYTKVDWVEAEGNGPRKIKLYNANKSK